MMFGVNWHDPLVWDAIVILACIFGIAALMPKFDSTDDKNWGDRHSDYDGDED